MLIFKFSSIAPADCRVIHVMTIFFLCSITLETLTMIPTCENVETTEGVPLTVTGVAQCKVSLYK